MVSLMALAKLTIPYVSGGDESRPFTEDLLLASLYILADARRGAAPISATVLANYPFQLRRFDGGTLLIDLLGLNQTRVKYDQPPAVEDFVEDLEEACEDPKAFLKTLKGKTAHFKDFKGQETIILKGLISKPGKAEEVQNLLGKTVSYEPGDGPILFDPVMKDDDVKELFGSLSSLRKRLIGDQKSLEKANKGLRDSVDIVKKVLREETQNIKDSSDRVIARLRTALKKKETRLKKKLDRDVARIRIRCQKQTAPLREDRSKRKRRIKRIEKKIDRLRAQKDSDAVRDERASLEKLEKRFKEIDAAVKNLEKSRNDEIKRLRDEFRSQLKGDEDRIKEAEDKKRAQLKEKNDLLEAINREAKAISGQIDALIKKKRNRLRSLLRYKMDLEAEEAELNIPFYIFQYGGKKFNFHPPVEATSSPGLFSRLRRMLADNPESKVNMLIRPRGLFTEKYLEKAVKSLSRDNPVGRMYRKEAERLNIFRSRRAVDLMMTGLVKMRRQGWISDSEYIRFQVAIVDKLSLINQP
jgi:hypothetical protein